MRERLIAAFVGLAIAVVALYGVPRAYIVADQVAESEQRKVERSIDLLADLLPDVDDSSPITDSYLDGLLQSGERIEYRDEADVVVASAGPELTGHPDDISVTHQLDDGSSITLTRSGSVVADRIEDAVMPVVLIGIGLIMLSALAGFVMARQLSRPFQELAVTAGRLGDGKFDLEEKHYSVPEAQGISTALQTSSAALAELVRRERAFAANASHQLRTPITALRLELEDLTLWKETPPVVATQLTHALTEVDRLSTAVTELLELARGQRLTAAQKVDLGAFVVRAAQRWERQASENGRKITSHDGALPAVINPGPVDQILDVLIDNALTHGAGKVQVESNDAGTHLSLSVTDEGARPAGRDIFTRRASHGAASEGIGLAVASELAEAIGGHLVLGPEERTRFNLMLPKRDLN